MHLPLGLSFGLLLVSCSDKAAPDTSVRLAETGTSAGDSGDAPPCTPEPELCDGIDNDCNGEVDETDLDADGFTVCDDCDDADPFIHPGAAEACDGIDNDCSGAADEPWDEDGDGQSPCGGDCNDRDPTVSGHLPEICDGFDNDCDGSVDEDFDLDGDGVRTCDGDCDDSEPDVWPGNQEICDGLDNDCDPTTDETSDVDGDGLSICDGDCDDDESLASPELPEVCDGIDNDCSGTVDEFPECFGCTAIDGLLVCLTEIPHAEAVTACDDLGGHLVILESPEESDAVAATVATLTTSPFWVGLTDEDSEGAWVWIDGTPLDYDSRWAPNEPNNYGNEDCVHNSWERVGAWNDLPCDVGQPFVCEGVSAPGG